MKGIAKVDTVIALLIIAAIIVFRYAGCSSNNELKENPKEKMNTEQSK